MKKNMKKLPKLPIIMYEEQMPGQEGQNIIPYIEIDKNDEMPKVLFISEYKDTGEEEIDAEIGSRPIVDVDIHKYVDMETLKEVLDPQTNDVVRVALGMKPLLEAQKLGQSKLDKIFDKAEKRKKALENNKNERSKRAFSLGENLMQKANQIIENDKKERNN